MDIPSTQGIERMTYAQIKARIESLIAARKLIAYTGRTEDFSNHEKAQLQAIDIEMRAYVKERNSRPEH